MWSPPREGLKPVRQWSTTATGLPNTRIPSKSKLRPGQRACLTSNPRVMGTIRFVGEVSGRQGVWIGVEWDDLVSGDMDGKLNGKVLFQLSQRAQRSPRTAASLCRESELTVSEHLARAENAPLIVDPRYDCYDWAVSPRDTYQGRFLMAMRDFMCCGAMCNLPDDEDDLRPLGVPSTADLVRIATVAGRYIGVGVPLNREENEGAELRSMKPPSVAKGFSDTGD